MKYALLSALLVAADQLLKRWTVAHLAVGETAELLPPLLGLRHVQNFGAAWSSFSGQRVLLTLLPALIIAAVLLLLLKKIVRHPLGRTACALVLAGGLGNLIDRVYPGYVTDMLYFPFWPSYPTFNLADICIVIGAALGCVYYLWLYEKHDAPKKEDGHGDDPADGGK
ncbi:MAG: signal peptidase II [Oscillospiraceae bacterium]